MPIQSHQIQLPQQNTMVMKKEKGKFIVGVASPGEGWANKDMVSSLTPGRTLWNLLNLLFFALTFLLSIAYDDVSSSKSRWSDSLIQMP